MRVFVTGATGFIGFAVVKELIASGHQVTGLARSEASGKKLVEAGAHVLVGTVDDLDCLRRGASVADGAIHTAFYHRLSHVPLATRLRVFLGGPPSGIVPRFMGAAAATDHRATEAIATSLKKGSPLAVMKLLKELKSSHVGFYHAGLSRATGKMAICATYAAFSLGDKERWIFQDVHEGGPAAVAGIRPGDVLVSVEERNFLPPEHPTFPIGATVSVKVLTRGLTEVVHSVSIPCIKRKSNQLPQVLPRPVVSHRRINRETGYIKIAAYPGEVGIDVANDMSRAIEALQPCGRLIMDLRGNSGGGVGFLRALSMLTPDRSPVGRFSKGKLVHTTVVEENAFVLDRIPANRWELYLLVLRFGANWLARKVVGQPNSVAIFTEGRGAQPFHGRIVLLVDRHTASANEMLIASAREWKLATTVGEPTPGRVLGGSKFRVGHDYWLSLPVGAYQTAGGDTVEGLPILPDVLGEFDHEQARAGIDTQLEKAIEVAARL